MTLSYTIAPMVWRQRMAALLAGMPYEVAAVTVNRLCGSGLEAVGDAARMIAVGEADVAVAGGVESMTRAPFSIPKATEAFEDSLSAFDAMGDLVRMASGLRSYTAYLQQRGGGPRLRTAEERLAAAEAELAEVAGTPVASNRA